MVDYKEKVCIEIINDTSANEDVIDNILAELLNDEYGRDAEDKAYFVKRHINHTDAQHIDRLIYAISGDVEEFAKIIDMDLDSVSDMEDKKNIWEDSDYVDEIQEKIDELSEEDDEDW